jgi:hypothetical protein
MGKGSCLLPEKRTVGQESSRASCQGDPFACTSCWWIGTHQTIPLFSRSPRLSLGPRVLAWRPREDLLLIMALSFSAGRTSKPYTYTGVVASGCRSVRNSGAHLTMGKTALYGAKSRLPMKAARPNSFILSPRQQSVWLFSGMWCPQAIAPRLSTSLDLD